MERTVNARQLLDMTYDTIDLSGIWGNCIGNMSRHGVVFIWGNSGNGKTSATLSLCKELARFGKVLYIPLEEGHSLSLQNGIRRAGLVECGSRFQILRTATLEELDERLSKKRSAEFIVIDSFQYMNISYRNYIAFKTRHLDKLLIFVSHADGKQPAGRAAKSVMYDADLKIWVEGHTAFSKGRFIGTTGAAVIWQEGAEKYWGLRPEDEFKIRSHEKNETE